MIKLESSKKDGKKVILSLPTNVSEITKSYLLDVTEDINPAENYSVVALFYNSTIANVLIASSSKKPLDIPVVPVFVKTGTTNSEFINKISTGDKLVVTGTSIARGVHLYASRNSLSIPTFVNNCNLDVHKNAFTHNEKCIFIEYKLIPNCDILSFYGGDTKDYNDPFVEDIED